MVGLQPNQRAVHIEARRYLRTVAESCGEDEFDRCFVFVSRSKLVELNPENERQIMKAIGDRPPTLPAA